MSKFLPAQRLGGRCDAPLLGILGVFAVSTRATARRPLRLSSPSKPKPESRFYPRNGSEAVATFGK